MTEELCGCGRPLRYIVMDKGMSRMSCNKYVVCLTYEEQRDKIEQLKRQTLVFKKALESIVQINGMDYEYKSWAKAALAIYEDKFKGKNKDEQTQSYM